MKAGQKPKHFVARPVKSWELYAYGFARTLVHFVNRTAWRISVEGAEKLPDGPFILSPVHRSYLDTPLVASLTTRRLRYMGKDGVFNIWGFGAILTALGGFPVHRGVADRDAMSRCVAVLSNGEPLVLFPEGTRNSGQKVDDVLEGAAYLALKANVPIVPVGIGGAERAWGRDQKLPRFSRVLLVVGDPIYPSRTSVAGSKRHISRSDITKLTEELQHGIQIAFDQAQEKLGLNAQTN